MSESLIIGYGVSLDHEGRVLLLRRRGSETLWPGQLVAARRHHAAERGTGRHRAATVRPASCVSASALPMPVRSTAPNRRAGGTRFTMPIWSSVEEVLDGAPDDESNPFDAMEWWDIESAIAELPDQQSELLATVIERLGSGWDFEADTSLDDLFDENDLLAAFPQPGSDSLAERDISLARLAARVAASNALGRELDWESEARSALKLGWTRAELEQVGVVAAELGRAASLECAPTNDQEN